MKKSNAFTVAALIIAVFYFASCKKSKDEPTPTPAATPAPIPIDSIVVPIVPIDTTDTTNTQRICGKTFKMTAWTSNPAWNGYTDIYGVTVSCYKDNTMSFDTLGTFAIDEGASKCNVSDPQMVNGTWYFTNNDSVLVLNDTTIYQVLINDGNTLKLTLPSIDKNVTPNAYLLFTLTYKKQ